MSRIESLLRKEIGLDSASIGSALILRTVRLRMKALGFKRVEDYEGLLKSSPAALEELIEAVVVTETWFFRDREPFAAFAQMAIQWLTNHPSGTLRTLSVPCSSGEEPYSLAMALLDSLVPPHRFVIHGVDISNHALARAKNAVYGRNSFRGKDLAFRDRHFRHIPQTRDYALNSAARNCVRFHRDNLLGERFLDGSALYDFIFCRNLLIYFDSATQVRALEKLHHLLTPDGILFVGPAELPLVTGNGFVSANLPMAFACRKINPPVPSRAPSIAGQQEPPTPSRLKSTANATTGIPPVSQPLPPPQERHATNRGRGERGGVVTGPLHRQTGTHTTPQTPSDLDVARQLADAGRLEEAIVVCESHLRKEGPSAQAYYLLGLLHDASGDSKASDYYRRALYLEPNHYETLLHMSLLLEKSGDPASRNKARTFRRRAERALQNPALSRRS